jgi:hypothetical protein
MGKELRPIDVQRQQLAALGRNPEQVLKEPREEKPVEKSKKEKVAAPDLFRDLERSLSGFGSAEFHILKHARRAEYDKQKQYAEEDKKAADAADFERKRKELEIKDNAKRAKNRERRKKRKMISVKTVSGQDTTEGPHGSPSQVASPSVHEKSIDRRDEPNKSDDGQPNSAEGVAVPSSNLVIVDDDVI